MQGMAEPLLSHRPLSPTLQRDTRSEKQVEEGTHKEGPQDY